MAWDLGNNQIEFAPGAENIIAGAVAFRISRPEDLSR